MEISPYAVFSCISTPSRIIVGRLYKSQFKRLAISNKYKRSWKKISNASLYIFKESGIIIEL